MITPPFFVFPKNDNEKLLNLQNDYYKNGKENRYLQNLFVQLQPIAEKFVSVECRRHARQIGSMSHSDRQDAAIDAAALFIEQYKKHDLVVRTSMISYLYSQVKKVLFYTTESQKFEHWCIKHRIDYMSMPPEELAGYKDTYEVEHGRNRKRKTNKSAVQLCFNY